MCDEQSLVLRVILVLTQCSVSCHTILDNEKDLVLELCQSCLVLENHKAASKAIGVLTTLVNYCYTEQMSPPMPYIEQIELHIESLIIMAVTDKELEKELTQYLKYGVGLSQNNATFRDRFLEIVSSLITDDSGELNKWYWGGNESSISVKLENSIPFIAFNLSIFLHTQSIQSNTWHSYLSHLPLSGHSTWTKHSTERSLTKTPIQWTPMSLAICARCVTEALSLQSFQNCCINLSHSSRASGPSWIGWLKHCRRFASRRCSAYTCRLKCNGFLSVC